MTNKTFTPKIYKATYLVVVLSLILTIVPNFANAGLSYDTGYYTNLCGSGLSADSYSCQANCNTGTGEARGDYVVKFTCDGNLTDCTQNESAWTDYQKVNDPYPGCGKTVQLDVFSKNCREDGPYIWSCGDSDLLGYMVWYSGDCNSNPGCPFDSTQVRVHKNDSQPWSENLTVYTDETFKAGIFTNGSGELSSNARLEISGSDYSNMYDNENSLDIYNLSIPIAGFYTIRGEIKGYENDPGCSQEIDIEVLSRYEQEPDLNIHKTVRNINDNTNFQESVSADPLDRVEFKLYITAIGSGQIDNVKVKDVLPWQLVNKGNLLINGVPIVGAGSIENEINLGAMFAGQTKTITFQAEVVSENNFGYGTTGLINTGKVWANTFSVIEDTAIVNVYKISPQSESPGLSIDKLVRNITDNTSWSNSVYADPLDKVEFEIQIDSIGAETANNVIVTDVLPSKLDYLGNLRINGATSYGNLSSGLNIGSMYPGQTKTITFDARVDSENQFNAGTTSIINTADVRANGLSRIYDSASLNVRKNIELKTDFSVVKKVKSLTENHTKWYESISSKPGDIVAFEIRVKAPDNASAKDVIVKDSLPSKIAYKGNVRIDGLVKPGAGNILTGLNIGDLYAGQTRIITFEAEIVKASEFNYGNTDLVNTAMAYNIDKADTATAKVIVNRKKVAGITTITTGVFDSFALSLIITFALTYCILFFSFLSRKSNLQFANIGSEAKSKAENLYHSLNIISSEASAEKRLKNRIAEIRKQENI
ncbi:MAG: DUF11 domain-containing protein [Candidatus Pacebacteria bacterium]|nr:DUF11 domain-containing protein [Candidatus Paceibacterota bacterium]